MAADNHVMHISVRYEACFNDALWEFNKLQLFAASLASVKLAGYGITL